MRFVVFGAGAIGGVIGGHLAESGHDVTLVARGEHLSALRSHGLTVETPGGVIARRLPAVDSPDEVDFGGDTVVLLSVKSQHTAGAVQHLALVAPPETPIVCVQNGVANEGAVSRWFGSVYGVVVICPATFLVPGVVQAHSAPTTGILDIGRHPAGRDEVCADVSRALRQSTFLSEVRTDIMRWKHRKLIANLGNAVGAICGPASRTGRVVARATAEGERILQAAGIDVASVSEDRARRGDHLRVQAVGGRRRPGGSVWQSLARGTGSSETDYLNGEIVRLGRLHGVPAPVNEAIQRVTRRLAAEGASPGSLPEGDLLAMLPPDPG